MLLNDLRYALRTLCKSPVFTAAAVLTMALAIGANTAIFSVVNAVLIRPLPFAAPDRLMQVAEKNDRLNLASFSASLLNYLSWKEQTRSFQDLAAIGTGSFALTGGGDPEQFQGASISPSLLPVLGIEPVRGRNFREGEDQTGGEPVAMIGEALWKRRFGGDPSLIGAHVILNGVDRTVVGIAPAALPFLTGGEIWIPLTINSGGLNRLNHVITVVGRLRPGVTERQAQMEMDIVAGRVGAQYPEVRDWGVRLVAFESWLVPDSLRTALLVLLGAVGFVLLIACANVANLVLSRAASRQKEIAVRSALGASRGRIVRQLLTESLLLCATGGSAGLLAALWAVKLMAHSLPQGVLPVTEISVDAAVLFFAFGVTLATGLLFGVAPAWNAAKTDLNTMLKQSGHSSPGARRLPLRHGLVAAELALATILLIGAGLLMQSLLRLERVQLGFRPEGLLTFQLAPPAARYPGSPKQWALYREMLQSLNALPGVRGAAVSSGIPMGAGSYTRTPMSATGKALLPVGEALPVDWRIVSPGYFRMMGIPLLGGRDFSEQDGPTGPSVTIVSRSAAQKFWGADDPIGKSLRRVGDSKEFTVVGVTGDVRHTALNQEFPSLYFSAPARVWPLMDVVVRTEGKPESALSGVRRKIHDLDPELPLGNVRTMEQWVANNAAQPRLNATLLGVFACVALLIAGIGVYGVLAYSVDLRTREIGLRMALGAQQSGVLLWVVGQGMLVAGTGIAAGLACAFALSRALAALLFGIEPGDPLTFTAVAALLSAVALAACLAPARRASQVDPLVALRDE